MPYSVSKRGRSQISYPPNLLLGAWERSLDVFHIDSEDDMVGAFGPGGLTGITGIVVVLASRPTLQLTTPGDFKFL